MHTYSFTYSDLLCFFLRDIYYMLSNSLLNFLKKRPFEHRPFEKVNILISDISIESVTCCIDGN